MRLLRILTASSLVVALVAPATALAQGADPDEPKGDATYPVSLDRIRRGLAAPRIRESRDGLKIQYYVDVYGRAPKLELFTRTENFTTAPVMYGGMTHQEFLNLVTPQEFKSPAADIPGAIAALVKLLADKQKKK